MSAITITEAAQDYLAELLVKQDTPGIGIRIFITQPGTQYAETCIAYCKPGEQKPEDTPIGLKDFTAWVDGISEPFLEDAVVDYATDRMGGQLTIKAPNAKVPMVNEDSPITERINYYLQTEINPGLASHGGQAGVARRHRPQQQGKRLLLSGGCFGKKAALRGGFFVRVAVLHAVAVMGIASLNPSYKSPRGRALRRSEGDA